eukprot:TRINITY_DN19_c0_g1_i4.p1 TRINITY_DN19_c0_g1~~TRINITY_DN19_c0_g1_i4.p1  ORF type:complete len:400 (+),score=92.58 TRINITY_DN19_c0_g1_i4:47-1201(+)
MADDDLVDFQEEEDDIVETVPAAAEQKPKKEGYSGAHASSFRDLLLKPELLQAITKHGFEHPSEVQQECIPQAILGGDVLCQAKSGMGKTAVFVLSTLQQIKPVAGEVHVLVLCHTRELAYQIASEYNRFAENFDGIRTEVIYGGVNIVTQRQMLASNPPNIIVGTPGRVLQLAREGALKLNKIKHFVLDECDKILDSVDMRADIQDVFKMTPHSKQVMMFSATLSKATRVTCKKFMQNVSSFFFSDQPTHDDTPYDGEEDSDLLLPLSPPPTPPRTSLLSLPLSSLVTSTRPHFPPTATTIPALRSSLPCTAFFVPHSPGSRGEDAPNSTTSALPKSPLLGYSNSSTTADDFEDWLEDEDSESLAVSSPPSPSWRTADLLLPA